MNMMRKPSQHMLLLAALLAIAVPSIAYAQPGDFSEVTVLIVDLLRGATGIGWMLLSLGFIYGVFKFIVNFDNEKEREEGKRLMFWSIVAVSVLLALWGILTLISNSFFGTGSGIGLPLFTPP